MAIQTRARAHAASTRLDIHELVADLLNGIPTAAILSMTGTKDRSMPARWAQPDGPIPRTATESRLRLAYRVWHTLCEEETPHVALAWLVGANPRLGEQTPVTAIREYRADDVLGAAEAFVEDVQG